MRLYRAHALGNDYLVLEEGPPLDAKLVRRLCDRHHGVGGDGILEPIPPVGADYGVRIWNPDGSVAEKSGNGLRIYAWWLCAGLGVKNFRVWTGHDVVACEVESADRIAVDMGRVTFEPSEIPLRATSPWLDQDLVVQGVHLRVVGCGIGNPHCVSFSSEPLDALPWRTWGAEIEHLSAFPHRTNVQFARVLDRSTVEARIWERGAGETLASGSSACAVAASGVRTGRLDRGRIEVRMPGGSLYVTVGEAYTVLLEGPVQGVATIDVDHDWLI